MDSSHESLKPRAHYRSIDAESAGQRLDNFLLATLRDVPRGHVYRLIRSGQVRVNSGRAGPSYRLQAGDRVRVPPVDTSPAAKPVRSDDVSWLADRIIYEDDRVLVLDKPAGLAVHGGSRLAFGCIEALRSLRPKAPSLELVHRLDRATSGCLLVAKKRSALRVLHGMLREGAIEKMYLALIKGTWQRGRTEIDLPLLTVRQGAERVVRVDESGKAARSIFRLVESFGTLASLVEISLLTGRTHQIRVHAAHLGHPLAGDERYGDKSFNATLSEFGLRRMFLHAHAISFVWPDTEQQFAVSAPLPKELGAVVDALAERGSG